MNTPTTGSEPSSVKTFTTSTSAVHAGVVRQVHEARGPPRVGPGWLASVTA